MAGRQAMAAASERRGEDAVVTARLALELNGPSHTFVDTKMLAKRHLELKVEEKLLVIPCITIFPAKLGALRFIPVMEPAEGDRNCIDYIAFYPLEDGMQATCGDTLDPIEKNLVPFYRAAENAALYTKMWKGDTYWPLAMLKEEDKQPLICNALTAFEAASKAAESLSPTHPLLLPLLLIKTAFYQNVMEWPECAIALGKRALEEDGPELASLDAESYRDGAEEVGLIKKDMKLWSNPKSKDPENTFKALLHTGSPPLPLVPRSVPAVAPVNFTSPGDWGYEVHERSSLSEMMSRKKAAHIRRGPMV